jgi:hypothetical protein
MAPGILETPVHVDMEDFNIVNRAPQNAIRLPDGFFALW